MRTIIGPNPVQILKKRGLSVKSVHSGYRDKTKVPSSGNIRVQIIKKQFLQIKKISINHEEKIRLNSKIKYLQKIKQKKFSGTHFA